MQPLLLSLLSIMATSLTASCLHAPMSWSPDGQWLAYTMVEPADPPHTQSGLAVRSRSLVHYKDRIIYYPWLSGRKQDFQNTGSGRPSEPLESRS